MASLGARRLSDITNTPEPGKRRKKPTSLLAAASDLARREVVAASTYAGPLLALVDMLLAAGATAALFYTIWRCAGAAGDAAATDGRKAHTI